MLSSVSTHLLYFKEHNVSMYKNIYTLLLSKSNIAVKITFFVVIILNTYPVLSHSSDSNLKSTTDPRGNVWHINSICFSRGAEHIVY